MNPKDLSRLRQLLIDRFNVEELRTLAFDIGVPYDELPQQLTPFARDLIGYCERRGITGSLLQQILQMRTNLPTWFSDLVAASGDYPRRTKIQILLSPQNLVGSKKALAQQIADLLSGVSPDDIEVIAIRHAGTEALVSTDAQTANALRRAPQTAPAAIRSVIDFTQLPPARQETWREATYFALLHRLAHTDVLRKTRVMLESLLDATNNYKRHMKTEIRLLVDIVAALDETNMALERLAGLSKGFSGMPPVEPVTLPTSLNADTDLLHVRLRAVSELQFQIEGQLRALGNFLRRYEETIF